MKRYCMKVKTGENIFFAKVDNNIAKNEKIIAIIVI